MLWSCVCLFVAGKFPNISLCQVSSLKQFYMLELYQFVWNITVHCVNCCMYVWVHVAHKWRINTVTVTVFCWWQGWKPMESGNLCLLRLSCQSWNNLLPLLSPHQSLLPPSPPHTHTSPPDPPTLPVTVSHPSMPDTQVCVYVHIPGM